MADRDPVGEAREAHVHDYFDAGLRYFTDYRDGTLPGGGAYPVRYARVFRCRACLAIRVERVDIDRNSYAKPEPGAQHATEAEEAAMRWRR